MSHHVAIVEWSLKDPDFTKGRYSRSHTWTFDGGAVVGASAAPAVVPVPLSDPALVDPEEAFVASLSSCHMLTFLHLAGRKGFVVEAYRDEAVGAMDKNERGVPWVATVTLHPRITYGGDKRPTPEEEAHLHHLAHEHCFIANSVKSTVTVAPPR